MADKALTAFIQEAYVQSISTRSVDDLSQLAAFARRSTEWSRVPSRGRSSVTGHLWNSDGHRDVLRIKVGTTSEAEPI